MNRFDRRSRAHTTGRRSSGQATVEFALLLPLLVIAALAIVQVALVAESRVQLTHAARVGARAAAVGANDGAVHRAVADALGVDISDVAVVIQRSAVSVELTVRLRFATNVPLVGPLVDDVDMVAVARMPREPP